MTADTVNNVQPIYQKQNTMNGRIQVLSTSVQIHVQFFFLSFFKLTTMSKCAARQKMKITHSSKSMDRLLFWLKVLVT